MYYCADALYLLHSLRKKLRNKKLLRPEQHYINKQNQRGVTVNYNTGGSIHLNAGFHSKAGSTFRAYITPCAIFASQSSNLKSSGIDDNLVYPEHKKSEQSTRNNNSSNRHPTGYISIIYPISMLLFMILWEDCMPVYEKNGSIDISNFESRDLYSSSEECGKTIYKR